MITKIYLLGLLGIGFLFFTSCNHKLRILSDGWTRITTEEKNYNNIILFKPQLLEIIDTNSIYKECCYIQNLGKKYQSLSYPNQSSREYFRFYSNGYCNCFINDKVGDSLEIKNFNPEITGFRGVYFRDKKKRLKIDLFTQTSGIGDFSNLKLYLKLSGDTLYMTTKNENGGYRVFVKKDLNTELRNIKGWKK